MIASGALLVGGMLPALATGLSIPITQAAYLITVFALSVCFSAPFLAALTARFERRSLLVTVLLIFAATHAACAVVDQFQAMAILRALSGLASALFTPQAAATVALLVPAERRASAIASVFMGWAVAAVIGMPLGAYIAAEVGWRAGYMLVAVGSLLAALAVFRVLPTGVKTQVAGFEMWKQLLGNVPLMLAIFITALQASGQFVAFGFLVPAFQSMASASHAQVSLLLAIYGLMGVVGSLCAGKLADKFGASQVVSVCCVFVFFGMLLWPMGQGSLGWLALVQVIWGLGGLAVNSTQQGRLANMAPSLAPVSIALNTSCMYLGQAVGTAIGVATLHNFSPAGTTDAGFQWLGPVGAPFLLAAIVLSIFVQKQVNQK